MSQEYVFYPDRFQTAAQFYSSGRPSYPARLIQRVRELVGLQPTDRVLDLGTGPGFLALDFAPLATEVIGIDPATEMLEVARKNALTTGRKATFRQGSSNDLSSDLGTFKLVTIGRAFHWMDRAQTLNSLNQLIEPSGAVVLFSESSPDVPANAWRPVFREVMEKYSAADPARPGRRGEHRHDAVLLDSPFNQLERIVVYEQRATPLERFADRILSYSSIWVGTPGLDPQKVGQEAVSSLEKFAVNGLIHEVLAGEALIASRS